MATTKTRVIRLAVRIEMTSEQLDTYARYESASGDATVAGVRADLAPWLENLLQTSETLSVEQGYAESIQVA